MNLAMLYAIAVVAVLIIDQAVKYWTNVNLSVGEVKEFIPGLLELTHYQNTGGAFGFLKNVEFARWLFIALVVIFSIVVIYIISKNIIKGEAGRWLLALVLAGAIGNGIDRVVNGYVIDMFNFEFMEFAVFNVADIFLTVCGLIFCVWLIFHKSEGPERPEPQGRLERGKGEPSQQRLNEDYLSQLDKPVSQARVDLDKQRAEAAKAARAEALRKGKVPKPGSAVPQVTIEPDDPFAEFFAESRAETAALAQKRADPPPKIVEYAHQEQAARPAPPVTPPPAPAPKPAPAPVPAPKKSDSEYSLDDILAEFSDK